MRHLERYYHTQDVCSYTYGQGHRQRSKIKSFLCISKQTTEASSIDLMKRSTIMIWYVIIKIKGLCPRPGSHRKVKQNDNLCPVQDSGSMDLFKVTARDQRSV